MIHGHTAFFYGTLMHPKILTRVIGNDGSHLQLAPAILSDHTRHRVKYADYPGVIPFGRSERLFKRALSPEEKCVRGMLVTGLTDSDMALLDVFEGSEYVRRGIQVHPLADFRDITAHAVGESTLPHYSPPAPLAGELLDAVSAETYIYVHDKNLKAQLWSYEDFVKQNAWKWYGSAADQNNYISEVDRRRGENEVLQDEPVHNAPL